MQPSTPFDSWIGSVFLLERSKSARTEPIFTLRPPSKLAVPQASYLRHRLLGSDSLPLHRSFESRGQHLLSIGLWALPSKYGASGYQHFHSSANDISDVIWTDSTIDFNTKAYLQGSPHRRQLADFVQSRRNEFLASKSGIHRHNKNMVHYGEHFFQRTDRRGWINDCARLHAKLPYLVQGPIQMNTSFLVHRDPIGAGVGKCRNVTIRILDHQVNIQR